MTGHLDTAEDRDYHRHEAWCMDANERAAARGCQECNGRGCPCCWDTDSDDEQESES